MPKERKISPPVRLLFALLVALTVFIVGLYFLKRTPSSCQALTITSPKPQEKVTSQFALQTVVDNRNPKCHWTVFEGQAGGVDVTDKSGQSVGKGTLQTSGEWTTDNPTTYSTTITLSPTTLTGKLTLTISEENPSGKSGQTVTLPIQY